LKHNSRLGFLKLFYVSLFQVA